MTSLQDERLRRLHGQFLDAAKRYDSLHFAAATVRSLPEGLLEDERWPYTPCGPGEFELGIPLRDWQDLLHKPPGALFSPLSTCWLRIGGQLWEGAFFAEGELRDDLQAQFQHLEEGRAEFERLATLAAGHFETGPSPHPQIDCPLESNPAHRWLERVCGMPFVESDDREAFLVKRVPGSVFGASAMTVEQFAVKKGIEGLGGDFIDRLLAGPDDAELTPREMAFLEARLRQPVSLATMAQPEYQSRGNKLRLIRDFNRNLHALRTSAPMDAAEPGDGTSNAGSGTPPADNTPAVPEPPSNLRQWVRGQVFISYSHKDKQWLNEVRTHLKPFLRDGLVTEWSDPQITTGSKWFSEIKAALTLTSVAVLLVTPDFLESDFIHEHELTPILKKAERGEVRIIWIPVRACAFTKTALKDYQAVIDPEKPLAGMEEAKRDEAWVRICQEIEKAVKQE